MERAKHPGWGRWILRQITGNFVTSGDRRAASPAAAPPENYKWIAPITNAPRSLNPVAAVALSIVVAVAAGLLIALGII
jgi:hypothetical protein